MPTDGQRKNKKKKESVTMSCMVLCWPTNGEIQGKWIKEKKGTLDLLRRLFEIRQLRRLNKSFSGSGCGASSSLGGGSSFDGFANPPTTSTTSNSFEGNSEIPAAATRPRHTRGSQKWSNVRAVMALYSSLRKIKRYNLSLDRLCSLYIWRKAC